MLWKFVNMYKKEKRLSAKPLLIPTNFIKIFLAF